MKTTLGILSILAACLSLAPIASAKGAASPQVGDMAPSLGKVEWVMNEPETDSIEQLRGDVVVIEYWGKGKVES